MSLCFFCVTAWSGERDWMWILRVSTLQGLRVRLSGRCIWWAWWVTVIDRGCVNKVMFPSRWDPRAVFSGAVASFTRCACVFARVH